MAREMLRPSPVPPFSRVEEESAWANFSKMRCRNSGGTPRPWSVTATRASPAAAA